MIGGLIVVVCVVVVLALAETLVPRLICAYVLWRQERARAQSNASAEVKPRVSDEVKVEKVEWGEVSSSKFQVSSDGLQVSGDGFQVSGDGLQVSSSKFQVSGDGFQVSSDGLQVGGAEAEKIWAEACGMTPSEIPSFTTDWHYMKLVHRAAELGHVEAMSALGDYAFQRGDVVEAFYWKQRVEMGGGRSRNPSLANIIETWTGVGCPDGSEEIGASLSEQQADFAHAVLCLKSRVDPLFGTMRLRELAEQGCEEARLFLRRS